MLMHMDTDFTDLYTYSTTTITRGIRLNCLRNIQDYYVDQITSLIGSLTIVANNSLL